MAPPAGQLLPDDCFWREADQSDGPLWRQLMTQSGSPGTL